MASGVFLGSTLVRLGAIIGLIKSAAFENDAAAGAKQAFDFSALITNGGRAGHKFVVFHALKKLKAFSAGFAFVVVVRHG